MKIGRMSKKEWNSQIVPKIKSGEIKDISEELPDSFLYCYQGMRGLIQESDGKKYYCSGWSPPHGKQYVEISEYVETPK